MLTTYKNSALAIAAAFLLVSCEEEDPVMMNPQPAPVQSVLLSGSWTVQTLIDDGENETADYADYVLTFNNQGQVTATHNTDSSLSRSGSYSVFWDDGLLELWMGFNNPEVISDLNDDWYFVSQDETTITWDDSGDVLVLEQFSGEGGSDPDPDSDTGGNSDTDPDSGTNPDPDPTDELQLVGNWTIQQLLDDGEDETPDYVNYVLTFNNQGQVTATHNFDSSLNRNGSYNLFWDDGQLELWMEFENAGIIDDLNDDWYFISQVGNTVTWDDSGDTLVLQQQ